ncbi:RbsD/FucU family protein [Acidipila sp. EB88]|uniref:RbsD/FucU family protein n=1 Tax=Acidipila sp. EB88 TaxID=2305226 RepID=UPI000F5E464E|nr:RbsD/FucU domain-containing protein [Acidipila sp. EB88]RRA47667.1 transport protein RbsD/FucU [Acidipila sp. EB88]
MLKGIDSLLSPQLLHVLSSMGHRHEIAIVDANYASDAGQPNIIRMDGISAPAALRAVLSVLPLERKDPEGCWRMIAKSDPMNEQPIFLEFQQAIVDLEDAGMKLVPISSADFKDRAKGAYAIVITGEKRPYGNVLLRKGTINVG